MTMTTLSSEGRLRGLCGGMIKRSRSYMLYFGVLLFVLYPLQYMLHIFDDSFDDRLLRYTNGTASLNLLGGANMHLTDSIAILLCMAVFLMVLVTGLSQFSYLHSKKAVDVYHELPVTRSTLVLANIIAAFVTVMLPLAANYLLVLVTGIIKRAVNPLFPLIAGGLLIDLVCWAVVVLAVLCIIAFVAVQVGSIFDNFLFSCELLVVFPAVIFLTINLFQQMLRGYSYSNNEFRWLLYTSPITLMFEHYSVSGDLLFKDARYLRCLLMVGVWLVISAVLLWATMKIYRRRPSEIAESSTSRKPLAQLGVLAGTYIGGALCGLLFSEISGRMDQRYSFVIWMVIFSILIYIMAQVILQRGFKGIRKSLLPGAVTVGAIAVFGIILATGGLGYESRIPAAADVASVSVDYRGRYTDNTLLLADTKTTYEDSALPGVTLYRYNAKGDVDMDTPAGIAAVQRLHQVAGDRSLDREFTGPRRWSSSLQITYTLQNGKQMKRYYDYSELSAVMQELIALENTEEFKRETHPVFTMDAGSFAYFNISDALGFHQATITKQSDMQRLMDAIAADMMAEDLTKLENSTELAPCYITFEPATPTNYLQLTEDAYNWGSVMVRSSYTNTLQVLRQLGLEQFAEPDTDRIAEMRVYYDNRFYGYQSPIQMMDMDNLVQYAKDMSYSYGGDDSMVLVVKDAAQMQQIKSKMFNFGCAVTDPMTVVFYDAEGNFGGCAQIDLKDLPAEAMKVFPEWVWTDRGLDVPTVVYESDSVSTAVIGGADGPTAIYVTE